MSSKKIRKVKVRSKKYLKKHSKKMMKKHRKHKVKTRKLKHYRGGADKPEKKEEKKEEKKNPLENFTDGITNNKDIKKLQKAASITQQAAALVGEHLGPDKEEKVELLNKEIKEKTKKLDEMNKKEKERSEKEQEKIKKLSDEIDKLKMELQTLTGAPPMKRASTMPLPAKSLSDATKSPMPMKKPAMPQPPASQ